MRYEKKQMAHYDSNDEFMYTIGFREDVMQALTLQALT
jgi:hypothetical protein